MKIFTRFFTVVLILSSVPLPLAARDHYYYRYRPVYRHYHPVFYPDLPPQNYAFNSPYMTEQNWENPYPPYTASPTTFINPGPIVLPGIPHKVLFTSLGILQNGSFGLLRGIEQGAPFASVTYPRGYIYGIIIPQGGGWAGNIYPTGKQLFFRGRFYQIYAADPGTAKRIRHYQQ